MQTTKWKASAIALVALAASGTASMAAYVHQHTVPPRIIRQQSAIHPPAASEAPCAALSISPPKYLFSNHAGASLNDSPWLSTTQLIASNNRQVSTINTRTGKETPLDAVTAVVQEEEKAAGGFQNQEMPFDASFCRLSPDGRWLLWPSGTRKDPKWEAMTVDGSERREWGRGGGAPGYSDVGGVAWMRDNTHWVEVGERIQQEQFRLYVRVYNVNTPEVREFPVEQTPKSDALLPGSPQFIFTTDGRAWIVSSCSTSVPPSDLSVFQLDYYELLPGADVWTLRHTPLAIQTTRSHYVSDGCALSPDGRWLVWRDNSDHEAGLTRIILSRPDGSGPRTLFETTTSLGWPRWTPDQQEIVFRWQGNNPLADVPGSDGVYAISLGDLAACSRPFPGLGAHQVASAGPFPVTAGQRRPVLTAKVAGR